MNTLFKKVTSAGGNSGKGSAFSYSMMSEVNITLVINIVPSKLNSEINIINLFKVVQSTTLLIFSNSVKISGLNELIFKRSISKVSLLQKKFLRWKCYLVVK